MAAKTTSAKKPKKAGGSSAKNKSSAPKGASSKGKKSKKSAAKKNAAKKCPSKVAVKGHCRKRGKLPKRGADGRFVKASKGGGGGRRGSSGGKAKREGAGLAGVQLALV